MAMDGLPEGVPLLPAGCRAASPGSPDLEIAAAAVQRGEREIADRY